MMIEFPFNLWLPAKPGIVFLTQTTVVEKTSP